MLTKLQPETINDFDYPSITASSAPDKLLNNIKLELSYPVYFTKNIFNTVNLQLVNAFSVNVTDKSLVCIFLDQGVADENPDLLSQIDNYFNSYRSRLRQLGAPMLIPGGEICKTDPEILEAVYYKLHHEKVDRHAFVLVIGGGAVLDAVGYAAATTHRGIRLIRMPTTVLGQNDAGIGVKTGVNRFDKKNFLGAFAVPTAVINDHAFLETLPAREKKGGMAEAIKVALIRDAIFFEWLESNASDLANFSINAIKYMIRRCAELHLQQITQGGDPFETGSSRPLDFGHWAAHKLESMSNYELRHGEAVAIGMAIDAKYALDTQRITHTDFVRIIRLIRNLGFEVSHRTMQQRNLHGKLELLDGIDEFREHLGGDLSVTMPNMIGSGLEVNFICRQTMEQAILSLFLMEERFATT
ncbi:MAG: 3-dehydroquinate synthase [Nitrosomonas sp.]|nr:3-dehydroquinate synthase [Nitrosomonas sp.]